MIAQSQSGTGKTAAFVLATLSRIDESINHPQVCILYKLLSCISAVYTIQVTKVCVVYCITLHTLFATFPQVFVQNIFLEYKW